MRQIIFVNEAKVVLAPPEYRENAKCYDERYHKSSNSKKNKTIRDALNILYKVRYKDNRISVAPEEYLETPDSDRLPEDVKELANKLDNPSFKSKKMQRIW